jgi:hypothetical protein
VILGHAVAVGQRVLKHGLTPQARILGGLQHRRHGQDAVGNIGRVVDRVSALFGVPGMCTIQPEGVRFKWSEGLAQQGVADARPAAPESRDARLCRPAPAWQFCSGGRHRLIYVSRQADQAGRRR